MQPQDMMSLGENGVKISRKTTHIGTDHLNPLHQDQDQVDQVDQDQVDQVLFGAHMLFQHLNLLHQDQDQHLNLLHQDQDLFGAHLLFQTRGKETDRGEELSNNL